MGALVGLIFVQKPRSRITDFAYESGDFIVKEPMVLGHESSGIVFKGESKLALHRSIQ